MDNKLGKIIVLISVLTLCSAIAHADETIADQRYELGLGAFRDGAYDEAHEIFAYYTQLAEKSDLLPVAYYMKALSSYKSNNWEKANPEFREFISKFPSHSLIPYAHFYIGNSLYYLNNFYESAVRFCYVVGFKNELRKDAAASLERLLWGYLTFDELTSLKRRFSGEIPEEIIHYYIIKYLQHQGKLAKILDEVENFKELFPNSRYISKVDALVSQAQKQLKDQISVLVVLPFSGDYADYGSKILNGLQLAKEECSSTVGTNIRIIECDSKGDPLVAVQGVKKELESGVPLAIIGPLLSESAVAVAMLADKHQIPMITPTASRDDLSEVSPFVFQLAITPKICGEALAEYSIDSLHDSTFAILAPDDQYGRNMTDVFQRRIEEKDRELVGVKLYPEGKVDFTSDFIDIKEPVLKKMDLLVAEADTTDSTFYDDKFELIPRKEWIVNIDAFFLPAYSDELPTILPQIPFNYISTRVFGANGWNVDEIKKIDKVYIDNAIFVPDDFFVDKNSRNWYNFARKYQEKYKLEPGKFEALGYDALKLVCDGIKKEAVHPMLLKDHLSGVHDFKGAAQNVDFNEYGANTSATILKFDRDHVVKLN
ncbi:penicillin-binding protein activator [bacterium]|nr:penicillin-binding protein activator [bacterium]